MEIIQRIIPKSQTKQRPGYYMNPKYITVHNTANTSRGADAEMHARYLLNGAGGRSASWHFTVDDHSIYQHLPTNENGWHAGDGQGAGNRQSIGIEICENIDGNLEKAIKNAQWLIEKLMKDHGIPKSNVVPHKKWSGKNCPRRLLSRWDSFIAGIGKASPTRKVKSVTVTKPATSSGGSIVDYLNSIGVDSSFANRSKLAAQYGISGYTGTAAQNLELLDKMRNATKPVASKTTSYTGDSIVDYLNSIGVDSSFSNRKKLAAQYGVKGYSGTASQNLTLLNKMRKGASTTTSQPKGDQKTNSIVDYLNSIGVDSSFANRKRLADKYGISNYKGTASQNTQLLKKMRG